MSKEDQQKDGGQEAQSSDAQTPAIHKSQDQKPDRRFLQILDTTSAGVISAVAGLAISTGAVVGIHNLQDGTNNKTVEVVTTDSTEKKPPEPAPRDEPKPPEKREHTAHPSFKASIDDQVKILSSTVKTAYYLDENFRIVGSFPYDFEKPPRNKKERIEAYDKRVKKALNEWHTENRKKLAQQGITVDLEHDKPRAQTSHEPGFAERIKAKASPKINRVYPNYRDSFAKTETSKYFVDDELRKEFLDTCIYGQAAVESGWEEDAGSSAQCYGLWQMQAEGKKGEFSGSSVDLMEKNRQTLEKDFSFRLDGQKYQSYLRTFLHSPEASSVMAPFNYDAYLGRIKGTLGEVKKRFPFESEKSFQRNFVMPMLYCSYIVGGGGVNRLLGKFLENEGAKYDKDFDEENFAWDAIKWFYTYDQSEEGKGAFGRDSVQYAMKIFAHAKLMKPVLGPEVQEDAPAKRPFLYPNKLKRGAPYRTEYSKLLAQAKEEGTESLGDDVDTLVKAGTLIKVEANEHFIIDGNLAKKPYLTPQSLYLLKLVAADFYTESGGYKLIVSDLFRTHADQQALSTPVKVVTTNKRGKKIVKFVVKNSVATTGISTHEFGNTFDITKSRVVTPEGKIEWTEKFVPMLRRILIAHQGNGALMALEENAAFHNMTIKPIFGEPQEPEKPSAAKAG